MRIMCNVCYSLWLGMLVCVYVLFLPVYRCLLCVCVCVCVCVRVFVSLCVSLCDVHVCFSMHASIHAYIL